MGTGVEGVKEKKRERMKAAAEGNRKEKAGTEITEEGTQRLEGD